MRRLPLLAIGLLVSVPTAAPRAHPPTIVTPAEEKGTAEEVMAFRRDMAAAIAAKDGAKLKGMYAETFVQTHGTGQRDNRDARIKSVLAGDPVIETLPAEDLSIRIHGGGWVAIATARSNRTMKDGTKQRLAWTAVYVRTEKSWHLAASHVTRLPQ